MSVNDAFTGSGRKFANAGDAIVADAECAFVERSAGAVGKLGVDDEEGLVGRRGMCMEDEGNSDCKCY